MSGREKGVKEKDNVSPTRLHPSSPTLSPTLSPPLSPLPSLHNSGVTLANVSVLWPPVELDPRAGERTSDAFRCWTSQLVVGSGGWLGGGLRGQDRCAR